MNEEFKNYELKEKEVFQWNTLPSGAIEAHTSVGTYTIRKGYLYFTSTMTRTEIRVGKFKDPKSKARVHFNKEA